MSESSTRRTVRVSIGYGWQHTVHKDERWHALKSFVDKIATEARNRASSKFSRVSIEDEPTDTDETQSVRKGLPQVSVVRLRATAGQFTWSSVIEHIHDADILVFDITPTKTQGDSRFTSPNVWLELGYALALNKPVYVVHEDNKGHNSLPSDLTGLIIGHVDKDGKATDLSLRMSLVQNVSSLLLERADQGEQELAEQVDHAIDSQTAC